MAESTSNISYIPLYHIDLIWLFLFHVFSLLYIIHGTHQPLVLYMCKKDSIGGVPFIYRGVQKNTTTKMIFKDIFFLSKSAQ